MEQALVIEDEVSGGTLMYKLGEGGTYSAAVPTAKDANTYTVYYYVEGDSNHENSAEHKIDVIIDQLDITGKTVDITLADTLTYNGTEQTQEVASVVIDGLTVTCTVSGNTGTDAKGYTLTVTGNGNFEGTATRGWSINKRDVTVTAKDQTILYGGTISGTEITAPDLVGGHRATATLIPSTTNVTVSGTITAEDAKITDADGKDVTANYNVSYTSGELVIEPDTSRIDGLTTENVTSANKADIEAVQAMMASGDTAAKEQWADLDAVCEDLLDAIEAAQDAADTENTKKVENVFAWNVKPEDKEALEDAKSDLEKALAGNSGNYTEAEKKAIRDEIQRIEDAMVALENVEDVTETVSKLTETVEPDDDDAVAAIEKAKKAYGELSDHEKTLVDKDTREKLERLSAAAVAYDIIKGDDGKWTKGSSDGLTFTANGSFSKFLGIKVDGKDVDKANYDAKSGSTIITLKASWLETLSAGEHTITVLYPDGQTDGTFTLAAKAASPATGDSSNILLWTGMLCVSALALAAILAVRKRRTTTK